MIASRNCPDQQVGVSGQDSHIKASNSRLLKSEVDNPLRIVQYQPCVLANKRTKGAEHSQEYIPQALPLLLLLARIPSNHSYAGRGAALWQCIAPKRFRQEKAMEKLPIAPRIKPAQCDTSHFPSRTGRNQPSNSHFIFGPAVWLRYLIRPERGTGLAYIDYEQQEFGVAAALSGDPKMLSAYKSGDPYLEFAKQAKAAPAYATKITHSVIRDIFKTCALGTQYGILSRNEHHRSV